MTEAELLKLIIMKCDDYNVTWWHDYYPQRNKAGLPDLILWGKYHLIWRELKLHGNKPEGAQVTWKYGLLATGQDYKVWYPSDLDSGLIDAELEALSK